MSLIYDRALPARGGSAWARARGEARLPERARTAGNGSCQMKGDASRAPRPVSPVRRFSGATSFPAPSAGPHA
jgi:hypothetical protein